MAKAGPWLCSAAGTSSTPKPGAGTEYRITFPGVAEALWDPSPEEPGA